MTFILLVHPIRYISLALLGFALRILTTVYFKETLRHRVEIVTPINDWKRGHEALHLWSLGLNPYGGNIFHEYPINLQFYKLISSYCSVDLSFCLTDVLTAILLHQAVYRQLLVHEQQGSHSIAQKRSTLVYMIYLLSPLTIMSCSGQTTTIFTNFLIAVILFTMSMRTLQALTCVLCAMLACNNIHYATLILPVFICMEFSNWSSSSSGGGGQATTSLRGGSEGPLDIRGGPTSSVQHRQRRDKSGRPGGAGDGSRSLAELHGSINDGHSRRNTYNTTTTAVTSTTATDVDVHRQSHHNNQNDNHDDAEHAEPRQQQQQQGQNTSEGKGKLQEQQQQHQPYYSSVKFTSSLTNSAIICLASIVTLQLSSYILMGYSWSYLQASYLFILNFGDLTPNIGLYWYFFTEIFDHFQMFFIWVVQMLCYIQVIPLCVSLRDRPHFALYIILYLSSICQPYPNLASIGLLTSLLVQYSDLFSHLEQGLKIACTCLTCACLWPLFWHLWIIMGTANANFYFGATLAFMAALIYLSVDLLNAHEHKMTKLKLEQLDAAAAASTAPVCTS